MNAPIGHELVVRQIERRLINAVAWMEKLKSAMKEGNEPAMQIAAAGIHSAAQLAQCLSHMVEKNIATHRKRNELASIEVTL